MQRDYYDGRYEPVFGFNTKQWWVYDNDDDCFIDPPSRVLKQIDKLESSKQADKLNKLVAKNPDWLYDEDFRYHNLEP